MAAPIIRSLTATPAKIKPGETATIVFDASDADARVEWFTGTVTDAGGTRATARVSLEIGDDLTYELVPDNTTLTVVRDPANPNRFSFTA